MSGRIPKKLFSGRVRTSTVALSVLFVLVTALYLAVRPAPETGPSSRAATQARQDAEEREPAERTPTPSPTAEPTPRETSTPEPRDGTDGEQEEQADEPKEKASPEPTPEAEPEPTPTATP